MKILVSVKRVTDYEAKLKISADGMDIVRDGVNMIMNPFDEIAVEEALRLKEKHDGEVVVVSVGTKDCETQMRAAMAMGADRGILVEANLDISHNLDSAYIAKILHEVVKKESPDLVLMGKQSIDDDNHQTVEMLAELWGVGQATQANTVTINGKEATVIREADGGLETLAVDLPCIISADLRLNEPRYAPLPGIMKAKRKPLDFIQISELSIDHQPQAKLKKLIHPPSRKSGQRVADISELVDKLKNEAKVL
ncbi:MAG: electron transfer flavoprotein subunit beta/FixA family protein [Myxococcales bacterium]|nr:electron transfer flavoprotein subunit beta/FixA family protein [Myxococcales bacterium]USN50065.1 MAG: electron transfer flavoprotein subunit beta/FixA family protein [Myxococcales bacterium]